MANTLGIRGFCTAAAAVALSAIGINSAVALELQFPPTLNEKTTTILVKGLVKSVVVRTDMGNVYIGPGSSSSIRVHETWNYARPTITHSLKSGVLTVTANCPNEPTSFNKCSDDLTLVVPSAVVVDAFSDFGSVTTKGLKGNEKLGTDFGDVTATGVSASSIAASTDYGRVVLNLATAPMNATGRSSFGDISVKVPAGAYAVSAKTNYGRVSVQGITQDGGAARHISARSSYGDIAVGRN